MGKSTWLRVLAGHSQGDRPLWVNGAELNNYRLSDYRKKVCLVSPSQTFPEATLWEILTCSSRPASLRLNQNRQTYQLDHVLKHFGLSWNQSITDLGHHLSTGQRQLIAILPLFAWRFDLVLLDEALENIDRKWTKWLAERLSQVQDARWIEISRSQNYLMPGQEVFFEKIATCW
ncbi:ATP-binding cassette domain-containing protein [Mycoplasma sp. ATU-Cv-508]|uniref:ATP-binding cassette domain-containing protein n=1 Tax=Mycoplasma sp. ATU-Cv-508 TaxID=2048001 RepID=UPI000FDD4A36